MAVLSQARMKPHFQTRHTLGAPTPPVAGGKSPPPHQRHSLGVPPPRGKVSLSPAPHQMRAAGSHTPRHPGVLPGHCVTVTPSPTDSPRHTGFSTPFSCVTATPRPKTSYSPTPRVPQPHHSMTDTVSAPPPKIANHWRQADIDTSIKRGHGLCNANHGWEAVPERPSRKRESSSHSPSKSRSTSRSAPLEDPARLFHHRRQDSIPRQGPKLTIRSGHEFTYDKVTASLACDMYNCTAGEARPSSRRKPGQFSPKRVGTSSPERRSPSASEGRPRRGCLRDAFSPGRGGPESPPAPECSPRRGGSENPPDLVVRQKSGAFTPSPGGAEKMLKDALEASRRSVQIAEPGMSPRAKSGGRGISPSTPHTPPAPSPRRALSPRTPPTPSPRAASPSRKAGELQMRGITDLQSNHRRGSGQFQGRGREIPSGSEQEIKYQSNEQVEWSKNVAHFSEKDVDEAVPEYIDDLARCGLETRRLMTAIRQGSVSKERGSLASAKESLASASAKERNSRSPVCEHASVLTVSDMGRSASQVFRQSSIPDWMSKVDPVKLNTRRLVSAYARTRDSLSASRRRSSSRKKNPLEATVEKESDTLASERLAMSSCGLLKGFGPPQRMRSTDSICDSLSGVLEGYGTPGHPGMSNTTAGSTPAVSGVGSASTSASTPPNPAALSSSSSANPSAWSSPTPNPRALSSSTSLNLGGAGSASGSGLPRSAIGSGLPEEVTIVCSNTRLDSQRSDWSDRLDTHRSDGPDTHRSDWSLASTALELPEDARRLLKDIGEDSSNHRLH